MKYRPELHNDYHVLSETENGLYAVLEQNISFTNVLERLGRFYSRHVDGDTCVKPIVTVLNPEHNGRRVHTYDDLWLFFYRSDFRVHVIKHHRYITGPHAARLYYRSRQTRLMYWIATLQIDNVMFYSEDAILKELEACIVRQEFFIAENSRKDKVAL